MENNENSYEAESRERKPLTRILFEQLKAEESKPFDPDENIPVNICQEDPEYNTLVLAGVTESELETGKIQRRKLLKAGFVFNNYPLFAIEKPLINVVIDGVGYGGRKLLTSLEMEKIKSYQRTHPGLYGTGQISSDDFREDMFSFIMTADTCLPNHVQSKVNFTRIAIDRMDRPWTTTKGREKHREKTIPCL